MPGRLARAGEDRRARRVADRLEAGCGTEALADRGGRRPIGSVRTAAVVRAVRSNSRRPAFEVEGRERLAEGLGLVARAGPAARRRRGRAARRRGRGRPRRRGGGGSSPGRGPSCSRTRARCRPSARPASRARGGRGGAGWRSPSAGIVAFAIGAHRVAFSRARARSSTAPEGARRGRDGCRRPRRCRGRRAAARPQLDCKRDGPPRRPPGQRPDQGQRPEQRHPARQGDHGVVADHDPAVGPDQVHRPQAGLPGQARVDRRDVDGRQVDRLDHAVGVGRGEQGHRGPAPRAGAVVEDPPGRLRRRPVTRLRSQGPETNARLPAIIASAELGQAQRQADPDVHEHDHAPGPAGGAPGPRSGPGSRARAPGRRGSSGSGAGVGGQPGQVEQAELARGERPPDRHAVPPGLPLELGQPRHAVDQDQVELDQPQAEVGRDRWPRAPPAGRPSGRRCRRRATSARACRQPGQEAVERDRLAARPRDRQVERPGRDDLVEPEERDRRPGAPSRPRSPRPAPPSPGCRGPAVNSARTTRQATQAGRSSASGTKNQNDQAQGDRSPWKRRTTSGSAQPSEPRKACRSRP